MEDYSKQDLYNIIKNKIENDVELHKSNPIEELSLSTDSNPTPTDDIDDHNGCQCGDLDGGLNEPINIVVSDTTPEEDYYRVMTLYEKYGALPFVMPYDKKDVYQKRFARWVNHRAVFKSVKWDEYKDYNRREAGISISSGTSWQ